MNWFNWSKRENEKTYGEYCEHRDLVIMSRDYPDNPTGKFDITCRSCEAKAEWSGGNYRDDIPKTPFKVTKDKS
jgi:hypothetical protein